MSVEIKDILIKAAEDVQSGMWCRNGWFVVGDGHQLAASEPFTNLKGALSARRCAEGSILVASALLGGTVKDAAQAIQEVGIRIPNCVHADRFRKNLPHFNDNHLPDDPFEAGQQLAELFRKTAEEL